MGIKVALEHRTSYTFDRLVEVYPHVVRLRPAPHSRTPIEAYSLTVEPADHFINWQQDAFGNFLARLVFPNRTRQLTITVGLIADMKVINPFDFFIEDWAEHVAIRLPQARWPRTCEPYLRPVDEDDDGSGPGELVREWVSRFQVPKGIRTIDFLVALNRAVNADVAYSVRMETGVQTPDVTLRNAIGSCRDSAWLLVSILRQLGLAARFVSGYLVQLTSDVEALDGPSGPAADFTDLHAWTEVYIPGAGWIGMDPTSGLFAGEGHIPLAATPHPSSAAPIDGATEMCDTVLDFSNTVTRIHEDPRVTLPYTDAAWATICDVGAEVDERLAAGDVRLTMGGEPTFVSIDNQVDDEWTIDADGPHKRQRAADLAARLKKVWAPNGLVQRGQGKWYPGEPLPRWQIALHWRADGQPLWRDEALLADPWSDDDRDMDPGAARRVLEEIAVGLGLPASQVRPAYEDPLGRLAAKVRLPAGDAVVPEDDLEDDSPAARAALLDRLDESVPTRPRMCFRCTAATTTPAGPAPTGSCAVAGSCCWPAIRRPGCGCRWTRSPGAPPRAVVEADPLARRPGAGRRRIPPTPQSRTPTTLPDHRAGRRGPRRAAVRVPAAAEELEHFVDLVGRVEAAAIRPAARSCSRATARRRTRGCRR